MAGAGAPTTGVSRIGAAHEDGTPLTLTVIASTWHREVMDGLVDGARRAAADAGIDPRIVRVPGAFELPLAAQAACATSDAVVALGAVVRGGTPHFDYVCRAATDGLTRVALDERTPIGFGVLTCESVDQALDRAGLAGSCEDKGYEATEAALRMISVLRGDPVLR